MVNRFSTKLQKQLTEERINFLNKSARKIRYEYARKTHFDLHLPPYTKMNLKCIIDLHVKPESIIFLVENTEESLCGLELCQDFFSYNPIKEKMDKREFIS